MLYSEWVYSHIFTNNDKHHLIPAQLQKISQWITSTYKTTVSTKSMQNILGQQEGWMSLESSCTVHKMSLYMSCLFVSSVQYKSTFSRQFHVTVVQELPVGEQLFFGLFFFYYSLWYHFTWEKSYPIMSQLSSMVHRGMVRRESPQLLLCTLYSSCTSFKKENGC